MGNVTFKTKENNRPLKEDERIPQGKIINESEVSSRSFEGQSDGIGKTPPTTPEEGLTKDENNEFWQDLERRLSDASNINKAK